MRAEILCPMAAFTANGRDLNELAKIRIWPVFISGVLSLTDTAEKERELEKNSRNFKDTLVPWLFPRIEFIGMYRRRGGPGKRFRCILQVCARWGLIVSHRSGYFGSLK